MHWLSSIVGLCHFSMKTIDSRLWHQNLSYTFDIQTCWLLELAIHFIALSIRSRWCMVVVYFENATLNCFGIYVYVVAVVAAVCDMRAFYIPEFFPSAICGHFTDRNNSQHIVYDYESLNVQTFSMRYQSLGRK